MQALHGCEATEQALALAKVSRAVDRVLKNGAAPPPQDGAPTPKSQASQASKASKASKAYHLAMGSMPRPISPRAQRSGGRPARSA